MIPPYLRKCELPYHGESILHFWQGHKLRKHILLRTKTNIIRKNRFCIMDLLLLLVGEVQILYSNSLLRFQPKINVFYFKVY